MSVRLKVAADLMTSCVSSEVRPFVALEHLESGTGRLVADAEVPERTAPDTGAASVEPGDVLFGKLRPYLAKTWLADRPVFASTELLCLRPRAQVDGRWLAYLVASSPVVEWAVATSDGTKMPRTSWEKLAEYRIEIPPLARQRAIADYLDREIARIDALIDKKQRMVELLEEQFESWREEMMVGRTIIDWTPLHHLTDPYRPIVYGIVQAGENIVGGVPYIKTGDLMDLRPERLSRTTREIDEAYRRARVYPGDLVVAMRASIGLPVVVPPDLPVANLTQGTARVAVRDGVDGTWLYHALMTRAVQEQCHLRAVGTTFKTLNIWDLRRIRIPMPPAEGQQLLGRKIEHWAGSLAEAVGKLNRQLQMLGEHRQALITAAVTGEVEVPAVAA